MGGNIAHRGRHLLDLPAIGAAASQIENFSGRGILLPASLMALIPAAMILPMISVWDISNTSVISFNAVSSSSLR